jgi:hypothetical protein
VITGIEGLELISSVLGHFETEKKSQKSTLLPARSSCIRNIMNYNIAYQLLMYPMYIQNALFRQGEIIEMPLRKPHSKRLHNYGAKKLNMSLIRRLYVKRGIL